MCKSTSGAEFSALAVLGACERKQAHVAHKRETKIKLGASKYFATKSLFGLKIKRTDQQAKQAFAQTIDGGIVEWQYQSEMERLANTRRLCQTAIQENGQDAKVFLSCDDVWVFVLLS